MALFQYFLSVQTSLERPSTQTCPPPPPTIPAFFPLHHQDATCDSQHISKHASDSVVNGTWIYHLKSQYMVQNRMLTFQNVFPVELKDAGS